MIDSFTSEYWFLSNFYPSRIEYKGRSYRTAEHAYQAAKTHVEEYKDRIAGAETPEEAKKLGNRCPYLRPDHEAVKAELMLDILHAKFAQNADLQTQLLATGDRFLVEGNWWGDKYWGVCNNDGMNVLGFLLGQVRYIIRLEQRIAEKEKTDGDRTPEHP